MCTVASHLAMAYWQKRGYTEGWHWGIYGKLREPSKTETAPALSCAKARAQPVHVTYMA